MNPEEGGDVLAFPGLDESSDGHITLHFYVIAGEEYAIQGATSLLDGWTTLKSWVADTSGVVSVEVEPNGARFFRIEEGGGLVLSANVVGYMKFTVPAGGKQMVSIPFENIASDDGTFRFGETQMARDLPEGSVVYFWDGEKQTWNGGMKSAFGWDSAEANHALEVGEGFCIQTPSERGLDVTAGGEVPSNWSWELVRGYAGGGKWSVMAYPYPVDVKFGNTDLASQLPQGSVVRFWDDGKQKWEQSSKGSRGWSASTSNRVIQAGTAFFIQTETAGSWKAVKPYTWP